MPLQEKLTSGEFVILAEMEPPKGTDVSDMVASATGVKRMVDAFVVPEMNNAVMRLSSLGGALLLQTKGLETVMQVCCRDRNRLALQGDLLAAHALGVPNVMAVAGDEITHGDHHQAKPVNDLDLLELLAAIKTMQTGRDLAGVDLKGAPQFLVGSTVKVTGDADALKQELADLDKKIAAGARFFTTQPVFDVEALEKFRRQVGKRPGGHHSHGHALEECRHGPLHQRPHGDENPGSFRHPDSEKLRPGAGVCADRLGIPGCRKKTGIPGSADLHHRVGGQTAVDPGGGRFIADSREFYQGYKG